MKKDLLRPNAKISLTRTCTAFLLIATLISCEKAPLSDTDTLPNQEPNLIALNSTKGAVSMPSAAAMSPHYWVALMVQNIVSVNNHYDTQANLLAWAGPNGVSVYACSTDCSGLLTGLLKQSYGFSGAYLKSWTGKSDPTASTYYNEIVTQDHFTRIPLVSQIIQGDIIALKYPTGSSSTGHIMIADGPPSVRTASAPLVSGTTQYEIPVFDCSSSGHGSTDTRYISSSTWDDGVGRGIFRIYCNSSGSIVGYAWSTYSSSVYYSESQRQLAVGRHTP